VDALVSRGELGRQLADGLGDWVDPAGGVLVCASLALIPIVTSVVDGVSASSCGGLVSPSTLVCGWGCVRFAITAPLQLTSVRLAAWIAAATRCG